MLRLTWRKAFTGLVIALLTISARSAIAYDLPALNLGFTSFLDGGPPAGPGFYATEYLQWYTSDKLVDNHGHKMSPNSIDVFVSLSQLIYQSNQKVLLDGKWGLDVIVPVVNFDVTGPVLLPNANDTGLGDVLVGPFIQWDPIMGANGPVFMHRFELQVITPTGRYGDKKTLNPGSNFLSLDPYWAATVFLRPQWTVSWRVHYLWNDTNSDPFVLLGAKNLQAGQAVHLNFATEYEILPKQLRLGINGYFLKQVTDTEINGASVGGRREQVVGVGPGLLWHISQNDHLFFNAYYEFEARNRPEGQRYNLRWVHHF